MPGEVPAPDLVLVGYRASDTVAALRFCNRAANSMPLGHRVLVLNDACLLQNSEIRAQQAEWAIIPGSNAQMEFSGWQEGLRWLQQRRKGRRSVLLVNDTVTTHRHFSRFRWLAFRRALAKVRGAVVIGFTDRLPNQEPFSVMELQAERWISTYIVYLSSSALERLQYQLWSPRALDECVPASLHEDCFLSARVSPNLRAHLRWWLFKGGWYRSCKLTEDSQPMLKRKARSIVSEMLLSVRASAHGIEIIDPFDGQPWLRWSDYEDRRLRRIVRAGLDRLAGR